MSPVRADYEQRCQQDSDITSHLPRLYEAARGYVAELGVRKGNSTAALLAGVEAHGGHLWSIDISPPDVPAGWWQHPQWSFLLADDRSQLAADWLPRQYDLLLIDTDPHTYESCFGELLVYGLRVRRGGLILIHDTGDQGRSAPGQAVAEWARLAGCLVEFVPESCGMGVIRR